MAKKLGPLALALRDNDPATFNLAVFAHAEAQRMDGIKESVTLDEWISDSIYRRCYGVAQLGMGYCAEGMDEQSAFTLLEMFSMRPEDDQPDMRVTPIRSEREDSAQSTKIAN